MENKPIGYVVWLALMFLAACLITIAIFLVMVSSKDRGAGFYLGVSALCAAEFVCFAWLANYRLSRYYKIRISGATQITIHVLIGAYFFMTVVFALVLAPSPSQSEGFFNAVSLLYAALTFLLLLAASMLYAKDIGLQAEGAAIRAESRPLRLLDVDVEQICMTLLDSAKASSTDSAAVDRVVKKIEALRTSLQYAPPRKPGTLDESGERSVRDINKKITNQFDELTQSAGNISGERLGEKLAAIESTVNQIEMLLKQRQQQLLV